MKEAGHSFVRIDGSVSAGNRISAISRFNSNNTDAPRFILCSLLAAGTGINLTRANWAFMVRAVWFLVNDSLCLYSHVPAAFQMDVWWNAAIENQAMDRIHRLSQKRNVTVMRFVMKGSIEERIIQVQERKSLQAKGAMEKLQGDEKRKALIGDLRGLLQIKAE